ncbi:MAG TPA: ATP-binding protein, partial [Chitinophagaceae bacterium]|nr:ATP-binding protein [Chitinophagaceae bacterium]
MLDTRLLIKGKDKEQPRAVFYSPAQQLFVSYFLNKGLTFYRPRQFSLLAWHVPGTTAKPEDYYYSLLRSGNGFLTINNAGLIWLGMDGEQRILNKNECIRYFLFKDRSGNIWHQQKKDNLICYVQAGTQKIIGVIRAGPDNVLIGVYQPDDSTCYLLTNNIFRKIVLRNGTVTATQVLYNAPARTEFNVLYAVNSSTIWLGSDRGLKQFTIADNTIKNVADLDNTNIRAITKLNENNYLVGTYDKGIYQFSNGKWIQLSSVGKNMPASAHAFIIDKPTSSVWVSSNEGILRIPLQQLLQNTPGKKNNITFRHFTNFGPDISPEFNGSSNASAAQLSDTCLAFANAKGLVVFNPLKLVSYPLPVNVLIEPVNENSNDSLSKNETSSNDIEFNPVVPYFGDREDIEVLYRLTNLNDTWHKLSPNAIISYNNVKPGDHDLQFRIRNYHDPYGKEVFLTTKSFSIPHRWYQKTWFLIAAGLFAVLLLVSLHYLRIWYILERRKELEKLIKTKTSELRETNENLVSVINDLSVSEANLKQSNFLKDEYYAVLTHDIRSPLKFLSFNISQLLELLPGVKDEAMKKGLIAAYQCSNDVYKLVDEFVCWIQDNEKHLPVQPAQTMIYAVAEDARKMYGFSLEGNKNTLVTDIHAALNFITDPKLLFIILRNAVDNANKYTSNGTITISASRQNDNLQLIVSDTGRGMKEDMVRQLIELQYRNVQLSYKERKSLGFYIMAMLIKKLGGSYTITSIKGEGTHLCFMIPELKD